MRIGVSEIPRAHLVPLADPATDRVRFFSGTVVNMVFGTPSLLSSLGGFDTVM